MDSKVTIRTHRNEDIQVLLAMTSEEEWGFSKIDCMASLKVDPKGLLVAEDLTGMAIGFIGLFNMSPNMTYLNAFIVRKDLRGKGIGKRLWETMMNATKDNVIVLDSVTGMKEWYKTQGFSYEGYYTNSYKGTISFDESVKLQNEYNIVPLSDEFWPAVVAYDKQVYPYSREHVLREWLCGTDRYSVLAFLGKNNVVGYANYHWRAEKEYNITTLYADNDVIAETLLLNILQNIPLGSVVYFDLLGEKRLPKYFIEFRRIGTLHRLFTKEVSGIQTDKIVFTSTDFI